jgi:hypothetical protein
MKKAIVLLCTLCLVLAYGTALGESPTAVALSEIKATLADIKAALNNIPPAWSKKLPCDSTNNCPRFEVLADWGNAAVLDKETGLVWEQSPSTATFNWYFAEDHCVDLTVGGRDGWRLPTVHELKSLVDRTQSPVLPAGHPFNNVQSSAFSFYWSGTAGAGPVSAWYVNFGNASAGGGDKEGKIYVWCVRGGQGVEAQ